MKRNNSQYHLNLNLTKYVVYMKLFELRVISVESEAILFNTNASIEAKVSLMDKQIVSHCHFNRVSHSF